MISLKDTAEDGTVYEDERVAALIAARRFFKPDGTEDFDLANAMETMADLVKEEMRRGR